MAREELGFDPNDLGGSAWVAAGTSFLLFALGACVPVLPFLVTAGGGAVIAAAALSGAALFALGAGITRLTRHQPNRVRSAPARFGTIAAPITYGIGAEVGTALR